MTHNEKAQLALELTKLATSGPESNYYVNDDYVDKRINVVTATYEKAITCVIHCSNIIEEDYQLSADEKREKVKKATAGFMGK